jgi:MinD superfamily P-loop ATPase
MNSENKQVPTLAVASGKGGTGKTTLSLALARFLETRGHRVCLYDTDVEEPNGNLFLKAEIVETVPFALRVPRVNEELCNGCGECAEICRFNAIVMVKDKPLVFPEMCHACGGCSLVCPEKAIEEVDRIIGQKERGHAGNIYYTGGLLNIGDAVVPPLIENVLQEKCEGSIRVIDAPPGTSCPVIESIRKSDYTVMVTEPTPFGLNDLRLAVGMADKLGLRYGVVVNRAGLGDEKVQEFCREHNIDILAEIPMSREVAAHYSRGEFIEYFIQHFSPQLESVLEAAGVEGGAA